ncbi:YceI family protein [Actinophytocola sp.]|uniref:YceI family protein n=1 Tax=Actinophytocola sp. TaxID=1872138 RepID=UPI002ED2207F
MSESVTHADLREVLPGWIAGTWTIDPDHSFVGFTIRRLMGKVHGRFTAFDARVVTEEDPADSTVTATIELASVETGVEMRDDQLRSAAFFDVENTPTMRFSSSSLRYAGENWVLTGDLTIRDITRPVDIDLAFLGIDPNGLTGQTRMGFEGRTTVLRSDFGLSFGLAVEGTKVIVDDRVTITLDVEAVLDT